MYARYSEDAEKKVLDFFFAPKFFNSFCTFKLLHTVLAGESPLKNFQNIRKEF